MYSTCYFHETGASLTNLVPVILLKQVASARARGDVELESFALIAGRFLARARKANRHLVSTSAWEWTQERVEATTDEWHRVRALAVRCAT